jgi:tRNA uridine 5-carbamoylmethylation protein Kti12
MGDIADGLINGDFDFYTGEYLGRGYGIPRTHNKALPWEQRKGKKGILTDPKENAYNGVKKYITQKWDGRKDIPSVRAVVSEYLKQENIDLKQKCLEIQKDFGAFVKFINQKLKTT